MSLRAEQLRVGYAARGRDVLAGLDLRLPAGQIHGLTGPSGAGKSTLARALVGLQPLRSGSVSADGEPITTRRGRMSGVVGLLHQSPRSATDPRMRLAQIIAEPLAGRRAQRREAVGPLAMRVGLTADLLGRYPHQVSDGQLQRACVARALAAAPRYLIGDEPTAMLDAAATATVAALLGEVAATGVGILMVSHDHHLLDALCHSVTSLGELQSAGPISPAPVPAAPPAGR